MLGSANHFASLTKEKSTIPSGIQIIYPTTIPIRTEAVLTIPFPYLFKSNVITKTVIAITTFLKLP